LREPGEEFQLLICVIRVWGAIAVAESDPNVVYVGMGEHTASFCGCSTLTVKIKAGNYSTSCW